MRSWKQKHVVGSSHSLDQYYSLSHRRMRKMARTFMMRPGINVLLDICVDGEENVDGLDGAFIVVANHTSHLDAPIMFASLPEHITARLATGAAADYFYKKRLVSGLTSFFFNTYPVDRRPRETVASGARPATPPAKRRTPGMSVQLLQAGIPLLIFPEGTRSRTGAIAPFKPGVAALSIKLNCPVVPVAMIGNANAMPVGAKLPKMGRYPIKVLIGRPLKAAGGENVEDYNRRIETCVRTMYELGESTI